MELYLLRHPAVRVVEGTCYGVTDLALAQPARVFAEKVKAAIPQWSSMRLWTSDLRRCREVAACLGEATVDVRLREMNFGAWENRSWKSLPREETQAWIDDILQTRPPAGESFAEVLLRIRELLAACLATGENALWITHAGIIRATLAVALEIEATQALRFDLDFGSLGKIRRFGNGWRLGFWNQSVAGEED